MVLVQNPEEIRPGIAEAEACFIDSFFYGRLSASLEGFIQGTRGRRALLLHVEHINDVSIFTREEEDMQFTQVAAIGCVLTCGLSIFRSATTFSTEVDASSLPEVLKVREPSALLMFGSAFNLCIASL